MIEIGTVWMEIESNRYSTQKMSYQFDLRPCFSRDAVPATRQAGACDVDPCEAYELLLLRSR